MVSYKALNTTAKYDDGMYYDNGSINLILNENEMQCIKDMLVEL